MSSVRYLIFCLTGKLRSYRGADIRMVLSRSNGSLYGQVSSLSSGPNCALFERIPPVRWALTMHGSVMSQLPNQESQIENELSVSAIFFNIHQESFEEPLGYGLAVTRLYKALLIPFVLDVAEFDEGYDRN